MKYSVKSILAEPNKEFLFFWGHQLARDGSITRTCMSQWWPASFSENEIIYKTAEHYMMVQKAKLFGDEVTLNRILTKDSPKDAKDLGRQIQDFNPETWDAHKFEIVKQGNYLKFSQNEELKHFLLQTKDKILVEASPVDTIWGIGFKEDHPNAVNPELWRGENLLGFALMEVRDQLKKWNNERNK